MSAAGVRRALPALAALLVLNAAFGHEVLWPTPVPVPDLRLAPELVWLWCAMLALAAWRGGVGPRWVAAVALLATLGAVGRYLDVLPRALLGRPIHLYWDMLQIPRFLSVAAEGRLGLVACAVLLVLAIALVAWGLYRGMRALVTVVARDAVPAALRSPAVLALTAAAALLATANHAGVRATWPYVSRPVLPEWVRHVDVLATALSPARLARALPASPSFAADFAALRGADVAIVMFESYGAVVFDDRDLREGLAPDRDALARAVAGSGRAVVSAFVTSPTFGGASDLAHLSLLSGLDLRDPLRHDLLVTTDRPTLVTALRDRGWRTHGLYPAVSWDWPEVGFYRFDEYIDARHLDWRGPRIGYWGIPDQYAIARFDRMHPSSAGGPPRFLFFPTINSHLPFGPVPPYQPDWSRLLSASPFDDEPIARALAAPPDWLRPRPGYAASVAYTYAWLAGWIARPRDRAETVVIVGDHQPGAAVAGEGARWDVPVHVVSDDPALLERLTRMGFVPGLVPDDRPLGGMHRLTALLLAAFDGRVLAQP
jgi:hypothetical protein